MLIKTVCFGVVQLESLPSMVAGEIETERATSGRPGGTMRSEMPSWSPAMPGEPIRCERKPRWSPAKPGEPMRSEMTTGDA